MNLCASPYCKIKLGPYGIVLKLYKDLCHQDNFIAFYFVWFIVCSHICTHCGTILKTLLSAIIACFLSYYCSSLLPRKFAIKHQKSMPVAHNKSPYLCILSVTSFSRNVNVHNDNITSLDATLPIGAMSRT